MYEVENLQVMIDYKNSKENQDGERPVLISAEL